MNYSKYRKQQSIPTIKIINCPACNKQKLNKYVNTDGSVPSASEETIVIRDMTRFLDACDDCKSRYALADEKFILKSYQEIAKAMQKTDADQGTDHNDFSLN